MSGRTILKHAELHILRDVALWILDPPSWSQAQDLLRNLRKSLKENRL